MTALRLRLLRIAVLLGLLGVAKPVLIAYLNAMTMDAALLGWAWLTMAGMAGGFFVIAVVARGPHQPAWVLGLEGLVAGLAGLFLPAWGIWVGPGPPQTDLLQGIIHSLNGPMAAPVPGPPQTTMALGWLAIVLVSSVRHIHDRRARTDSGLHAQPPTFPWGSA